MSEIKEFILPTRTRGKQSKEQQKKYKFEKELFVKFLLDYQNVINQKISIRGWCYILEGLNKITKSDFRKTTKFINELRKDGSIPIDFVASDITRKINNYVEIYDPSIESPEKQIENQLNNLNFGFTDPEISGITTHFSVDYWQSQEYYIQLITEKIDLYNLFLPVCEKYKIPTGNAKGWGDLNMRNSLAQNFKKAEKYNLIPVLLHFGDFDPTGLYIVKLIKKHFKQIEMATGWDPEKLIVDSFGLSIDFINTHNLMWIDNLKTSSGQNLGSTKHQQHNSAFVQEYIKKYGPRKCEANAVLPVRNDVKELCEKTIKKYLGQNPFKNVQKKERELKKEVNEILDFIDFQDVLNNLEADLYNLTYTALQDIFDEFSITFDEKKEELIKKFNDYFKQKGF